MKIIITSKKPVLTQFGRHPHGVTVDVPDALASFLIERGDAAAYETKAAAPAPAPEPEQTTAEPGEAEPKRGRAKKA
jgi:hypothetical protein